MKTTKHIALAFVAAGLITFSAQAQSIVDPGISVHNYKHPNKAAQAKAAQSNRNAVRVPTLGTVEQYGKYGRTRSSSNTPKYAPRPAALVVTRDYKVEGVQINPLESPRNYKPQVIKYRKDTAVLADYYQSGDAAYPTKD